MFEGGEQRGAFGAEPRGVLRHVRAACAEHNQEAFLLKESREARLEQEDREV